MCRNTLPLMQPDRPLPRVLINARDCGWDSHRKGTPHLTPDVGHSGGQTGPEHRVQQRPPQVAHRSYPPGSARPSISNTCLTAESGHSLSRFASRVWFARQALLGPGPALPAECPQWSVILGLLSSSPHPSPSSCPPCFLLLTSRCSLLSVCLSPPTPQDLNRCCSEIPDSGKCSFSSSLA